MKYIILLFALTIQALAVDPAQFNSQPVDWDQLKMEVGTLELSGAFKISLPAPMTWKLVIAGKGPTGSPFHMWSAVTNSELRQVLLVVLDVELQKVPETERDSFMADFVRAFRRTGIEAMEKKGYAKERFDLFPNPTTGNNSMKAISVFTKSGLSVTNVTYAIPARQLYLLGYEGNEEQEPKWFLEMLSAFHRSLLANQ